MSLDIYVDPKDPLVYLALPGTTQLLAKAKCDARWFPMRVDGWSDPGPEPAADAGRGVRHRWFRANYRERELQHYAGVHQLPLTNLYRQSDSSQAAMALLWLSKQPAANNLVPMFLVKLTQAHWANPNATMDLDADILPLLRDLTDNPAGFKSYRSEQGPAELEAQLAANSALGVTRGPAYHFEEQLYIGREHLPLLTELISESLISE